MSALDTQPETLNFLSPLNFQFSIKKCPGINFFVQKVNIPSFSISSADSFNPFVRLPYAGDHINFDPMTVTFKVDEKLQNYMEIYNWLRELGFPESWDEYKAIKERPTYMGTGLKSDASILICDSSKKPFFECVILNAFPVALSSLQFASDAPDVQFITAEAVFHYTNFKMNDLIVGD